MDLKAHLVQQDGCINRNGFELMRIASLCGVTPVHLYLIALGHKPCSARLACELEYATSGVVLRTTSLPSFPWSAPARQDQPLAA